MFQYLIRWEGKIIQFLNELQQSQIGFDFILEQLEVITPFGKEKVKHLRLFNRGEQSVLQKELDDLERTIACIKQGPLVFLELKKYLHPLKDVRGSLRKCRNLDTLDDVELFEIKQFSLRMEDVLSTYKEFNLNVEKVLIHSLNDVVCILNPHPVVTPSFYIYDSYSETLSEIRKIKKKLEDEILHSSDADKREELRKERQKVVILEEEEELRIRKKLTREISEHVNKFEETIESLAQLDVLMAKAALAINWNACKPELAQSSEIIFEDMVNPMVDSLLKQRGKSFVPVSIHLCAGPTIITGANMGGKSVTLYTVLLNLMLAHMGFFVFSGKAKLPVLDFFYLVSGDAQSLSQGLSSYGAEICALKKAVEDIKKGKGFVALDEFARGTNPKEGRYLVKALCKFLKGYETISLISTHYDGVAGEDTVHYQVIGLKNINFDQLRSNTDLTGSKGIEMIQEMMDYRLEKVTSGSRFPREAINLASILGLDGEITEIARKYYEKGEENDK